MITTPKENVNYQEYYDKYIKLIRKISCMINNNSANDNLQELSLLLYKVIINPKSPSDPIELDKYIKTCLWNFKKSKNSKLAKQKVRMILFSDIDATDPASLNKTGRILNTAARLKDKSTDLVSINNNLDTKHIEKTEVVDGDSFYKRIVEMAIADENTKEKKSSGAINISDLARSTGFPRHKLQKAYNDLRYDSGY